MLNQARAESGMLAVEIYERAPYRSSAHAGCLRLGTIERDASGGNGRFSPEAVRGEKILAELLKRDFRTVLDVGAGALEHSRIFIDAGKIVDTCDFGTSNDVKLRELTTGVRKEYVGDFNELDFPEKYDVAWCSHVLDHQLNPNLFLRKLHSVVKEGGCIAIVVPPRKPFIVDGHVSLWNAGLLLYHLVLAGLDCSRDVWIRQYDCNIGIIVRKHSILPEFFPSDLCMDTGDLQKLSKFFPNDLNISNGTNGDILSYPVELASEQMRIAVLIPARYNSTRFPGKALHMLCGVPMAKLVYSRCTSSGFDTFLVSDDERICGLVENSVMTSSTCENGTARCAEAALQLSQYDAFINVQGDMPDVTCNIILAVARALNTHKLVTAYTTMPESERANPNSVKLIHNGAHAIWSCRSALKYGDHHLGVYGYHKNTLSEYATLPFCKAEYEEGLEQLRWLQAGYKMHTVLVEFSGIEVNTPEDADKWEKSRTVA